VVTNVLAVVERDSLGGYIREKEADFVLSVKDNQPTLQKQVAKAFEGEMERAANGKQPRKRQHVMRENKHGREEERSCYVLPAPQDLRQSKRWMDVKSIGMAIRRRTFKGKEQICVHYYISSLSPERQAFRSRRPHALVDREKFALGARW